MSEQKLSLITNVSEVAVELVWINRHSHLEGPFKALSLSDWIDRHKLVAGTCTPISETDHPLKLTKHP